MNNNEKSVTVMLETAAGIIPLTFHHVVDVTESVNGSLCIECCKDNEMPEKTVFSRSKWEQFREYYPSRIQVLDSNNRIARLSPAPELD